MVTERCALCRGEISAKRPAHIISSCTTIYRATGEVARGLVHMMVKDCSDPFVNYYSLRDNKGELCGCHVRKPDSYLFRGLLCPEHGPPQAAIAWLLYTASLQSPEA